MPVGGIRHFRYESHPRSLDENRYVYAVLSRRAKGISIGINLCPEKSCNFGCVYCQVDRRAPAAPCPVDEPRLLAELEAILREAASGRLAARAMADGVPERLARVADVAFSGDGEPTSYPGFGRLVDPVADAIDRVLPETPLILITNAGLFHLPEVAAGLERLAARGGRVWAKLDAGTEPWFQRVNGTRTPFRRVLDNIGEEARRRPLVIQSLFLRLGAEVPDSREIDAYTARLAEIAAGGGRIAAVQILTIARPPADPDAAPLPQSSLEEIAGRVRAALPGVLVEVYAASRPGTERAADGGAS